jgi:hypothetical protein
MDRINHGHAIADVPPHTENSWTTIDWIHQRISQLVDKDLNYIDERIADLVRYLSELRVWYDYFSIQFQYSNSNWTINGEDKIAINKTLQLLSWFTCKVIKNAQEIAWKIEQQWINIENISIYDRALDNALRYYSEYEKNPQSFINQVFNDLLNAIEQVIIALKGYRKILM